jgi:hypothetical protein
VFGGFGPDWSITFGYEPGPPTPPYVFEISVGTWRPDAVDLARLLFESITATGRYSGYVRENDLLLAASESWIEETWD